MEEATQAVQDAPSQQEESPPNENKIHAQSVGLSEAVETDVVSAGGSIDILLDMKVPVTVTIGHTEMPVQKLLLLGPGSIFKLDKSIDEPIDLYLKDAKFATGSVVVVEGQFAVKIKQILGLGDSSEDINDTAD